MRIIWIDDEPQMEKQANNLRSYFKSQGSGISLPFFINVRNENVLNRVLELKKQFGASQPDLIIVDHVLDKTSDAKLISQGSTLAELLREKWVNCPIIGVTAASNMGGINLHKKEIYEDLFEKDEISTHFEDIFKIAKYFKLLKSKKINTITGLLKLIKPPAEDISRLTDILPTELKGNLHEKSRILHISKWVRHVLFARPGFLYNHLWAATLLGLNHNGFKKVERFFKNSEYHGIFSVENRRLWWASGLKRDIYSYFKPEDPTEPLRLGSRLPGIKTEHYSTCYVCDKRYPEVVAYVDESDKVEKQMHLRCSEPHPAYKKSLFYEEVRKMKST